MSTTHDRQGIVNRIAALGKADVGELYEWMARALGLTIHQGAADLRLLRQAGKIVREPDHYRLPRPQEQRRPFE